MCEESLYIWDQLEKSIYFHSYVYLSVGFLSKSQTSRSRHCWLTNDSLSCIVVVTRLLTFSKLRLSNSFVVDISVNQFCGVSGGRKETRQECEEQIYRLENSVC